MRAIVREAYGGPENLTLREVPLPEPGAGEVRIRIKAFGINRAETYMRRGAWGDVAAISGIECVGEIDADPSGTFARGQKVAAIMGGLGRTRPGSYGKRENGTRRTRGSASLRRRKDPGKTEARQDGNGVIDR